MALLPSYDELVKWRWGVPTWRLRYKILGGSLLLFAILTAATLFSVNIKEYYFNVVTVNYKAVLFSDIKLEMFGDRWTQAFLYPFYIFF